MVWIIEPKKLSKGDGVDYLKTFKSDGLDYFKTFKNELWIILKPSKVMVRIIGLSEWSWWWAAWTQWGVMTELRG